MHESPLWVIVMTDRAHREVRTDLAFFQWKKQQNTPNDGDEVLINRLKHFFFEHHGDGMSMDRADPKQYDLYCTLSEGRVEAWRQELIASDLEKLSSNRDPQNTWITVGNLLRSISRSRTMRESNAEKLLTLLTDIAPRLDQRQRILILEHFAGRTSHQKDGGIHLIHTQTDLTQQLVRVVAILSDFRVDASEHTEEMGWQDTEHRYAEALRAVRRAYELFGVTAE